MDTNTNLQKKLSEIQKKLNVPKNQVNAFGNYKYRSAEDILDAVKPLLGDAVLTVSDDLVLIGDRYYVKATATIALLDQTVSTTAFAREEEAKKGMDSSQITGSTSSYARKYALNGLFCIDDTKDADTQDNTAKTGTPKQTPLIDKSVNPNPASSKQIQKIKYDMTYLLQVGYPRDTLDKILESYAPTLEELTMAQASSLIGKLQEMATVPEVTKMRAEKKENSPKIDDPTINF